ncbi:hypothetical protein Tco_1398039 [Tanacetum coccineum]
MSTANQQMLVESGTVEGVLMRNSMDKGPYKWKEIADPNDAKKTMYEPITDLSTKDREQYYADIKDMNYILQGIPNYIYNFVDACEDA